MNKLKQIRIDAELSVSYVAAGLDVSESTVRNWESGQAEPSNLVELDTWWHKNGPAYMTHGLLRSSDFQFEKRRGAWFARKLGPVLEYLRAEVCRMSQAEVAAELGVTKQSVWYWEKGSRKPSDMRALLDFWTRAPGCIPWLHDHHLEEPSISRVRMAWRDYLDTMKSQKKTHWHGGQ